MAAPRVETLAIRSEQDVVRARQAVRQATIEVGLSLVEQTKVVTAASELARNTLVHGGGGDMTLEVVTNAHARGLRLVFADEGPGIADIELALTEGYTTGGGLGLGLSGARKLMSEFSVESQPGRGTRVTVARWK
jgi:serine/threonine-protein kinase RsbT